MAARATGLGPRPRALASLSDAELDAEVRRAVSERLDSTIPVYLAEIYRRDIWREVPRFHGGVARYQSFPAYVTEELRLDIALVLRMARTVPKTESALTKALRMPDGGDRKVSFSSNNIRTEPTRRAANALDQGTSRANAIKRLEAERPDLLARVHAGALSPHAAMIAAGFRPRTVTVRVDSAAAALAVLLKHFTRAQIRAALDQRG
jgi:hypothetical protein